MYGKFSHKGEVRLLYVLCVHFEGGFGGGHAQGAVRGDTRGALSLGGVFGDGGGFGAGDARIAPSSEGDMRMAPSPWGK